MHTAKIAKYIRGNYATERWLRETAETLLADTIMPVQASDPVYALHRSFLHLGFLYYDLRNAIRWEDGPQIIQHWVLWLPRFLATGKKIMHLRLSISQPT